MEQCKDCTTPVGCKAAKVCRQEELRKAVEVEKQLVEAKESANAPAQEASQAAPGGLAGDPKEAAVVASNGREAAAALVATSRLCKTCRWAAKPFAGGWNYATCTEPTLPVNLVHGQNSFPCVTARGYAQLCGPLGLKWRSK